jgi:hypothetical protein
VILYDDAFDPICADAKARFMGFGERDDGVEHLYDAIETALDAYAEKNGLNPDVLVLSLMYDAMSSGVDMSNQAAPNWEAPLRDVQKQTCVAAMAGLLQDDSEVTTEMDRRNDSRVGDD